MRAEYKVNMLDALARPTFTLVNARTAAEARRVAARNHPTKIVIGALPTGRHF
jgi:hypothetical protein